MLEFIETYNDLVENVKTFNECISSSDLLISRLNQFRHWYYIVELDMFAPSKFIGYKGNNLKEYSFGSSVDGYMDGRDTEHKIRQLFMGILTEGQEIHHYKLVEFLNNFERSPNIQSHIHVI